MSEGLSRWVVDGSGSRVVPGQRAGTLSVLRNPCDPDRGPCSDHELYTEVR